MRIKLLFCIFIVPIMMGVVHVSNMVQDMKSEINELNSKVDAEEEEIKMLKAEWIYLTRPSRITKLTNQHLNLSKPGLDKISDLMSIPLKEKNTRSSVFDVVQTGN